SAESLVRPRRPRRRRSWRLPRPRKALALARAPRPRRAEGPGRPGLVAQQAWPVVTALGAR
ncbi:MAG TPA: hypothetical protein VFR99_07765, partial [Marmoricola sp.]|nr:hypothetical protein [Marmoricola sp.]